MGNWVQGGGGGKLQNGNGDDPIFSIFDQKYVFTTVPVPGHFYSCVVSKYLLRENEISFLLL